MKNWQAELADIANLQDDLRRRLEALDRRVAEVRLALASEPPAPATPPSRTVPPPLPGVMDPPRVELPRIGPVTAPEPPPSFPSAPARGETPSAPSPEPPPHPGPVPAPAGTPAAEVENLEMRVGRYWLVRVGIVVLLTGLVLLGNLAYQNVIVPLGAPGKLALLYLAGGLLTGLGWWLERRVLSVRNYARVLLAGGAAAVYYATYAAHFVDRLRVIDNPWIGGVALLLLAGALTGFAARRRQEGVAFTAILLSYYTAAINPAPDFALFSNAVLTVAAVFLLAWRRWIGVTWLSLLGSYASFFYWKLHAGSGSGGAFWATEGFLVAYWMVFTAAVFLRRGGVFAGGAREMFLTANNAAFFALFAPAYHDHHPEAFWMFAVAFGLVLIGLSALSRVLRRDDTGFDGAWLAQGLVVLAVGIVAKFSGYQLAVILAIESIALLALSPRRHTTLLRAGSALCGIGATGVILTAVALGEPGAAASGALVAALLLGNAFLLKRQLGLWPQWAWSWRAAGYVAAGLLVGYAVLAKVYDGPGLTLALAGLAVAAPFLLRFHRLPEIGLLGQILLLHPLIFLVGEALSGTVQSSSAWPCLAGALLLMHWWQRPGRASFAQALSGVGETAFALVAAGSLLIWIGPDWSADTTMRSMTVTGLGVLAYGLVTRAVVLALCGQAFVLTGAALCLRALALGEPSPGLTASTIVLTAIPLGAVRLMGPEWRRNLAPVAVLYRVAMVFLVCSWCVKYLPEALQFPFFALAALLVLVPGALRAARECVYHSCGLVVLALLCYVAHLPDTPPTTGLNLLGFGLVVGFQQAARRLPGSGIRGGFHPTLCTVALTGMWFEVSRWCWLTPDGVPPTIVWAGLAFATLAAGFFLRERALRLMGLLILAVAVGHVFFIDVWKLGQLAGVLGIIILALALLSVGFVYNRYADQIRRLL